MANLFRKIKFLVGHRILVFNLVLLALIKVVIPYSGFYFANIAENLNIFDSREIIKVTNQARASNNLNILAVSTKLDLAATQKLADMEKNNYFAHISPSGTTPWFWISQNNYAYSVAGENLAMGFINAQDVLNAWLDSPSHKANILNTKYKEIGVAVKSVKIGSTNGIVVVQMFGNPQTSAGALPKTKTASNIPAITPTSSKTTRYSLNRASQRLGISTESSLPAINQPIIVKNSSTIGLTSKILNKTNNIFVYYIVGLFAIAALLISVEGVNKVLLFNVLSHAILLVVALTVPVAEIVKVKTIF